MILKKQMPFNGMKSMMFTEIWIQLSQILLGKISIIIKYKYRNSKIYNILNKFYKKK